MNFKTTVVLLVTLLVVGVLLIFTRETGEKADDVPAPAKLLAVSSAADITRVTIANDEGQRITLDRADGKWRLTEPVSAAADESAANSFAQTLADLQSRGQVDAGAGTGLDTPRYKLEITTRQPQPVAIEVGARSGAGDNLYVRLGGKSRADVVPAALAEQLDKPLKDWRRARLFDVLATDVKQVRVATTQQTLALEKSAAGWKITEPEVMPAEEYPASDLASAVANLRAEEFVTPTASADPRYGLDQPVLTVSFSTAAPTTQPATQPTTQPPFTMVRFGAFDDVLKKNVYASVSTEPGVVLVSASVLDSFRKRPLELRDKKVLFIEPEHVTRISIAIDKPATTQPTTREAVASSVTLERSKREMGPMLPATAPATAPSTTQASTQPSEPPSVWNVASRGGVDADDSKVNALLDEFKPLRVDKYFEPAPTTQPAATVSLAFETTDARHEIRFTDPGDGKPLNGAYNGLSFEVARWLLEKLEADFVKSNAPKPTE